MRTLSALLLSCLLFLCNCASALANPPSKSESHSIVAVNIDQPINDDSIKPIIDTINNLEKDGNVKEVWFRINSPGGQITSGFTLIDKIEELSRTTKTVCVADHLAASMAFILLQTCDERVMTKRTVLLAHEVQGGETGNAHELRHEADMMDAFNRALAEIAAARMGMPVKEYLLKIYNRNWLFNWEDALKYNAVDRIVEPTDIPASLPLPAANQSLGFLGI